MALRGKKPDLSKKRLKAFFYGCAGVGKTMAAIQFPAPYVIDCERGAENAQYIKIINDNNGAIFQTTDFSEMLAEVKSLLTDKHHYKTLVIDPFTTIYNSLLDSCAQKLSNPAKGKDGTEMGRHYSEANKQLKRLFNLLFRLDMNVIITSHAKSEYGAKMEVIGQTFDCYKKIEYIFDLAIEIIKPNASSPIRKGIVRKTRISSFEDGSSFEFSYTEIADRYGRDVIEKEVKAQELASDKQLSEISELLSALSIGKETTDKWLEKASADSFADMESSIIQKCIDSLKSKVGISEKVTSVSNQGVYESLSALPSVKVVPLNSDYVLNETLDYHTAENKGRRYD